MNKNRYILILIIGIFFLNLPFTLGSTIEKTKLIYTDRDSYVSTSDPNLNAGRQGFLIVSLFYYGAFIHFDLSDKPSNITKVEVVLNFFDISHTTAITIRQVDSNAWGEFTITWANAPSYSTALSSGVVSDDDRYSFELPSASHQWSEVTLFVLSSDPSGSNSVTSKDNNNLIYEEDVPHIKYTYLSEAPD